MKVLCFGIGVQSTAMVAMVIHGDLPRPDHIIFSDPQWEEPITYQYLEYFKNFMNKSGLSFMVATKGNIRKDALSGKRFASMPFHAFDDKENKVSIMPRQCTPEYKIFPVQKKMRELMGVAKYKRVKGVHEIWLGISTDEADRAKDSVVKWIKRIHPLLDKRMNRLDCENYLRNHGYKVPPKSSCIGCPYHSDYHWKMMKKYRPESFEDGCQFDEDIRTDACRKGKRKSAVFLHKSLKPLRQVDFHEDDVDLFTNECEGYCGL